MSETNDRTDGAPTPLEARSREHLLSSVEALDARVLSRLNQARQAALAEAGAGAGARTFRIPGVWLPVGVLAAASVLAIAVWIARPVSQPQPQFAEASPVEDAEILASGDNPELYADEADFYEWAGSDTATAAGGAG
jgi:hypothetical protein